MCPLTCICTVAYLSASGSSTSLVQRPDETIIIVIVNRRENSGKCRLDRNGESISLAGWIEGHYLNDRESTRETSRNKEIRRVDRSNLSSLSLLDVLIKSRGVKIKIARVAG